MTAADPALAQPHQVVAAWTAAWEHRDAAALNRLFAADAEYVSALYGPLRDLPRQHRVGCRTWRQVRITLLEPWDVGSDGRARGAYRFDGVDREDRAVSYEAEVAMTLRRRPGGGWEVASFREARRPASP
jgi:ketosteroid isomerase-like protein